jgi:hypothetical protein
MTAAPATSSRPATTAATLGQAAGGEAAGAGGGLAGAGGRPQRRTVRQAQRDQQLAHAFGGLVPAANGRLLEDRLPGRHEGHRAGGRIRVDVLADPAVVAAAVWEGPGDGVAGAEPVGGRGLQPARALAARSRRRPAPLEHQREQPRRVGEVAQGGAAAGLPLATHGDGAAGRPPGPPPSMVAALAPLAWAAVGPAAAGRPGPARQGCGALWWLPPSGRWTPRPWYTGRSREVPDRLGLTSIGVPSGSRSDSRSVAAVVMGMLPWLAEGRHRGSAAAAPARARRDRMTGLRAAVDKVADAQDALRA